MFLGARRGPVYRHPCPRKLKQRSREDVVAIRRYGLLTNEPVEQVFQGIREGFIPIIKNAPGFLAYYTLDSGYGTLTSISVFEDRAGAEKSNKLAEDWVGRTLSSAIPTSPETIIGEVGAHELNLIKLGIREILE
jgi:hypothetical protein